MPLPKNLSERMAAQAAPTCANCPFSVEGEKTLICRRYPPKSINMTVPIAQLSKAQQLQLPPEAHAAGMVNVHQVVFQQVAPEIVCGEHPDYDIGDDEEESAVN